VAQAPTLSTAQQSRRIDRPSEIEFFNRIDPKRTSAHRRGCCPKADGAAWHTWSAARPLEDPLTAHRRSSPIKRRRPTCDHAGFHLRPAQI